MRILGDVAAKELLSREYRAPFVVPDRVWSADDEMEKQPSPGRAAPSFLRQFGIESKTTVDRLTS